MNTQPGIIGTKLGMTQLYKEDGTVQRVTVVDTSSVIVVGKRARRRTATPRSSSVRTTEGQAPHQGAAGLLQKAGVPAKRGA